MFLTRVTLLKAEALRRGFRDPYDWHKALWRCFHDVKSRPFLFRIDEESESFRVFMQSSISPLVQPWGSWEMKTLPAPHLSHETYAFSFRANTEKRDFHSHARVPVQDPTAWLARVSAERGFEIVSVSVTRTCEVYCRGYKHALTDFNGVLKVSDREKFVDAVSNGIGSAKYAGFGLLLVRKHN